MGIADIWMRASGSDLRFHIATVLGICMDEWNSLAPNSGLFNSRGSLLAEEIWKQKLQLSLVFRRFKTRDENGFQEQGQWIRFLGLPVAGDSIGCFKRSLSSAEDKDRDALAPISEDAVFNLLEFQYRLEQKGKLRSREFRGALLTDFLAN